MGSVSIVWRLEDEANENGLESGRIGDIIAVAGVNHEWNALERTIYGVARITDIPDALMSKLQDRFHEAIRRVKVVKDLGDGTWLATSEMNDPWFQRRFLISKAQCVAEWPELENQLNLLFDPEFTLPTASIPSLTWTKFKAVFWDRVAEAAVSDLET